MTEGTFESKALIVNLQSTQAAYPILSSEEKWFLDLSIGEFGLNKRTEAFFKELHHPYPNFSLLIKDIREVALQDFWFYEATEKPAKALNLLREILVGLLKKVSGDQKERVLHSLLEFTVFLHDCKSSANLQGVIKNCLNNLSTELVHDPYLFARTSVYLKPLMSSFGNSSEFSVEIAGLLRQALRTNLKYWQTTTDFSIWLNKVESVFPSDDWAELEKKLSASFFSQIEETLKRKENWQDLIELADFSSISNCLRNLVENLKNPTSQTYYLLYLIGLPGMAPLTDQLLWDLNRIFRSVEKGISENELTIFINLVFNYLKELRSSHMTAVLDCLRTLGKSIYATRFSQVITHFNESLLGFGFVSPGDMKIDSEWRITIDPCHVKNIRIWLDLFTDVPEYNVNLLTGLIVNLKMNGVCILDTDLFQKDITKLLNANIGQHFTLIKQLGRIFPVYFSEIGAEGELRDVTTHLDELTMRQDRLAHFLRKQIHAESNNTHVQLVEKVVLYWYSGRKSVLKDMIAKDVMDTLDTDSPYFTGVNQLINNLLKTTKCHSIKQLLSLEINKISKSIEKLDGEETDKKRLLFLLKLYGLLKQKYTLDSMGILPHLRQLSFFSEQDVKDFERLSTSDDHESFLLLVFSLMKRLREIILDKKISEGQEDIYLKRHIAAGIPSMYGRYFEPKFAALGLTFRLENLASKLITKLIQEINLRFICLRTLKHVARVLDLFRMGLELSHVSTEGFDSSIKMLNFSLTTSSFSLSQFINIFQFLAANVKQVIKEYFLRFYDEPLKVVIKEYIDKAVGQVLDEHQRVYLFHKHSEEFYRGMIASAFLIQNLDNFIANVLEKLQAMSSKLSPEIIHNVMTTDLATFSCFIDESSPELNNRVFIGAKGYFLKKLHSFSFKVPDGFILTTELFRLRRTIQQYDDFSNEVSKIVNRGIKKLEMLTGRKFGDPLNPLLLSVRSGAAISMPGAMNSFLNVGLNLEIVNKWSKQPNFGWTAWDCYRRLLQTWGMAHEIPRDEFDKIISRYKSAFGVKEKIQFASEQMRTVALSYRKLLEDYEVQLEERPFQQVMKSVFAVLDSWHTERAKIYRKRLEIADEWGTAVIVQAMVLGNIGFDSGTGVVFTKDPLLPDSSGISLYGDFMTTSQGEDVVGGLIYPHPISEVQRIRSSSPNDISLEGKFPEIYQELKRKCEILVFAKGFGHQEIEFTFESSRKEDLFFLQTRDYLTAPKEKLPFFSSKEKDDDLIGHGIGIAGGALNGIVAFDQEDLQKFSSEFPGQKIILVRPDTVPDDIGMIFECDGLLTARGGVASHAAVTAARLGKTCIVNCRMLQVDDQNKTCLINDCVFRSGDNLAIDGALGAIYRKHLTISIG